MFKALECQIWSTNTKPFSWESESNPGTLQKLSPYTGVAYKFVLNCGRNVSWLILVFSNVVNVECSTVQYSTGDNVTEYNYMF